MTHDEFLQLDHAGIFERCVNRLKAKYPSSDAEEYVGYAMLQLTENYAKQYPKGEIPAIKAEGWVYIVALNALRRREGRRQDAVTDFAMGIEDPLLEYDPIHMDIERTRRARQAAALSDTLRTFVQEREAEDPTEVKGKQEWVGLRRKECMERFFFGQSDDKIAAAMRQYQGSAKPINLIQKDRSRSWDWIEEIKQKHDVRRTLFVTEAHKPPPSRPYPKAGLGSPQVLLQSVKENPLPTGEAMQDTILLSDWFPDVTTSKVFYILLTRDTQAYCPSAARLQRFAEWYAATKHPSQANCPDDLLDIGYHALERQCRFCVGTLPSSGNVVVPAT